MTEQGIPFDWVQRLCAGAISEGVSTESLFSHCLFTPKYGDNRDVVSPAQYLLLCMDTARSVEDGVHALGAKRMQVAYSALTVRVLLGSSVLESGIHAVDTLYRLAVPSVRLELRTDGDYAVLNVHGTGRSEDAATLLEDIFLGWLFACCSRFLGRPLPILDVVTRDRAHMNLGRLHWAIRAPVRFGSVTGFRFSKALLSAPCAGQVGDCPHWECLDLLLQHAESSGPVVKLGQSVTVSSLRLTELAQQASVSASTLRRRVEASQGGFRQLRNKTLVDAGVALLKSTTLSVDSIAEQLGYADARSFRRFLKTATGKTPQDIREDSDALLDAALACQPTVHQRIREACAYVDR